MEKHLSRREFLKASSLALVGALVLKGSQASKESVSPSLAEILHYEVLPSPYTSPIAKGGIGYNAVFLPYRDKETQEKTLDFAVENGATFLRVFFDYPTADYEPTIGVYDENVLQQFSSFCAKAAQKKLSLIVALSDGYRMGACLEPNIIYGSSKDVIGPYYQPGSHNDPWMSFYTDPHLTESFVKRTKQIARSVTSSMKPYLDAGYTQLFFEPMNEPRLPKGAQGRAIFNQWLLSISSMLKEEYGIPCMAGVADPKTVNISLINTLHYYPYPFNKQLSELINQPFHAPPVFIEETGLFDLPLYTSKMNDQRLYKFISDIFLRTTKIDPNNKTIQPLIPPLLCLWHIDPGDNDHYTITKEGAPSSLALLKHISTIYQQAAYLNLQQNTAVQ